MHKQKLDKHKAVYHAPLLACTVGCCGARDSARSSEESPEELAALALSYGMAEKNAFATVLNKFVSGTGFFRFDLECGVLDRPCRAGARWLHDASSMPSKACAKVLTRSWRRTLFAEHCRRGNESGGEEARRDERICRNCGSRRGKLYRHRLKRCALSFRNARSCLTCSSLSKHGKNSSFKFGQTSR